MRFHKNIFLLLICLLAFSSAFAQTEDQVYNKYLDFNLARLEGRNDDAFSIGEEVMTNVEKLNDKARIDFFYALGNLYENDGQSIKALPLYEKVAAAVPNYYVVQRALGYIYNEQANQLANQLNAVAPGAVQYNKLTGTYKAAVKRALPHLEKAQACDPSDETLAIIKLLYKNIQDANGLKTLDARLKTMSANCIDLLDDK